MSLPRMDGLHRRRASNGALFVVALALVGACVASSPAPSPSSVVTPGPAQSMDLEALRDTIFATYRPELLAVGIGQNVVVVTLIPTATQQADAILGQYGVRVRVSLGFFPYPPPASLPPNVCAGLPGAVADPGLLRATIELATCHLAHVASFPAKVRLTNTGSSPMAITTGSPLQIYLFGPGETTPIGASAAAVAGVGLARTLMAGESIEVDAGGGTGSCDLALGYELPNGTYTARAAVELDQPSGGAYFWSDPVTVELRSST